MERPDGEGAGHIRQHYLHIKGEYPDAIVLYRLGDFYEAFDDDAATCACVLDVVLTSRSAGRGQPRVRMAGFPVRWAQGYIDRLVTHGYTVAVAEPIAGQNEWFGEHAVGRVEGGGNDEAS